MSYDVKFSMDKMRAWLGQPHLTKNLEKKFVNHVEYIQSHKMPRMHKFLIVFPIIESEKISMEDKKEYCFGVCMLFYLVKHSRSDIANSTRELSKAKNEVNPVVFKELLHMTKYILDTKNFGLKLEPNRNDNEQ